jgi:predicted MFS family arabinose efflux permease
MRLRGMLTVLRHPVFARLFAAQIVALTGTGLLTVALALLAYDLAGARAGTVLGTALTIKMLAYVGVAPLAAALFSVLPRKAVLIGADLVRAGVALMLPFISEIWQIYVLIFALQTASATFTPAFQAVIPDVLRDEEEYTSALSLSRLAFDIETLVSPALAGVLLLVMGYNTLFLGTVAGFLVSALLILRTPIPQPGVARSRPFRDRLTRGVRLYLAVPQLRGLLALSMAVSAVISFVLVDTVVLVRAGFGGNESGVAAALAAFGAGSMLVALVLPRVLRRVADRVVMLAGGAGLAMLGLAYGLVMLSGTGPWTMLLVVWAGLGALNAAVLTPSGRLLKRSASAEDRPAIFTAHFALSHACWLLAYPTAGWLGPAIGLPGTLLVLAVVAAAAVAVAVRVWPSAPAQTPASQSSSG